MVYNWKTNIPGVQISPGLITGVSMIKMNTKDTQSKGKLMDYKITFITKNSLNLGSVIEILFPSGSNSFIIDNSGALKYFYVESGLEDISVKIKLIPSKNFIINQKFHYKYSCQKFHNFFFKFLIFIFIIFKFRNTTLYK